MNHQPRLVDWRTAVALDDTLLGYRAWLAWSSHPSVRHMPTCSHCLDDPPQGHICPHCNQRSNHQ